MYTFSSTGMAPGKRDRTGTHPWCTGNEYYTYLLCIFRFPTTLEAKAQLYYNRWLSLQQRYDIRIHARSRHLRCHCLVVPLPRRWNAALFKDWPRVASSMIIMGKPDNRWGESRRVVIIIGLAVVSLCMIKGVFVFVAPRYVCTYPHEGVRYIQ